MPDHILQQVRERLSEVLDAAMASTVYKGRRTPIPTTMLPAVNILSVDESTENTQVDDGVLLRAGTVTIELFVKSVDDCEPELFSIQSQVEKAIAGNPTLSGVVHWIEIRSSRQDEVEVESAEYALERRILSFEFQAMTAIATPDVPIN